MDRIPNWLKWLIVAAAFVVLAVMVLAVDRRASRVEMPPPDNTFGIYRGADSAALFSPLPGSDQFFPFYGLY